MFGMDQPDRSAKRVICGSGSAGVIVPTTLAAAARSLAVLSTLRQKSRPDLVFGAAQPAVSLKSGRSDGEFDDARHRNEVARRDVKTREDVVELKLGGSAVALV